MTHPCQFVVFAGRSVCLPCAFTLVLVLSPSTTSLNMADSAGSKADPHTTSNNAPAVPKRQAFVPLGKQLSPFSFHLSSTNTSF